MNTEDFIAKEKEYNNYLKKFLTLPFFRYYISLGINFFLNILINKKNLFIKNNINFYLQKNKMNLI